MTRLRVTLATALLFACSALFAQHDHGTAKKPAMDPAMMEAMMKAGTPGEPHKKLDVFTGTWETKATFWPMPRADPMTMTGTSTTRSMWDGRVLEQRFTGSFMGMPFEGIGYTGYDNLKKQYWSTWMDNMSTAFFLSTGTAEGSTWSFSGMMPDPMSGKDVTAKSKIVVNSADQHTMEMWGPGPDGKMFKNMEMVYTRKK